MSHKIYAKVPKILKNMDSERAGDCFYIFFSEMAEEAIPGIKDELEKLECSNKRFHLNDDQLEYLELVKKNFGFTSNDDAFSVCLMFCKDNPAVYAR